MLDQLAAGDDSVLNHVCQVKDGRGYTKEYQLRRRETDILLTGYSVTLRAKVIDRWRDWRERSPILHQKPAWSLHRPGFSDEGIGRHANEITAS